MRKSYLLALVLLAAVSAWLYSGSVVIGGRADSEPSIAEAARNEDAATAVRVAVRRINVQTRSASLLLRGRTLAKDRVSVRAQVEGTVKDLPVAKGQAVRRGDLLCELDTRTRAAHLAQARAQLEQAEADYEAAAKLAENGYTARTRVRTLRAQRDAARAVVEAAAWELENTRILAPEDGIIETLDVRRGSLLRPGDICAGLVKVDPMLAVAHVSENELAGIEVGSPATVRR